MAGRPRKGTAVTTDKALPPPPVDEVPTDGRTLRAQRTRQAIIDAHMALMLEGDLQPTAGRVAERAGVSLRALWSHFKDLESLFGAAGEKALEIQFAEYHPIDADLPLPERVDQFCMQRARMLDVIAGASRAAQIRLPFSKQLHANRVRHNIRLRQEIEDLFATEIARAPDAATRDKLVTALLSATTWSSWMGCRDDLTLSFDEAVDVMHRTVAGLVGADPLAKQAPRRPPDRARKGTTHDPNRVL
jgi:TetR/AcrR family transcriptional regulator of autoinduction and epiphytic fitness